VSARRKNLSKQRKGNSSLVFFTGSQRIPFPHSGTKNLFHEPLRPGSRIKIEKRKEVSTFFGGFE
jgi:hypothetical protein